MLRPKRAEELAGRVNRKRVGSYPPETLLFVDGVHAKVCDLGWNAGAGRPPRYPLADVTADDVEAVAVVADRGAG